jgi:hypothetical protein
MRQLLPPTVQPLPVIGSQVVLHNVTFGMLPLPLLSETEHVPPLQSPSVSQNFPQALLDADAFRQMRPGAQSVALAQDWPSPAVPAATHARASFASRLHSWPLGQPHCGAASLHGVSVHGPLPVELVDTPPPDPTGEPLIEPGPFIEGPLDG